MEETPKTDLEAANEALAEMAPNISASDRREAPGSVATIVKYLKGDGKDLDTAMELLQFFRKRIEDRRKVINEA